MEETLELSQLEKLPPDALVAIISKLDPKSVIKVCSTSKTIRAACKDVWRHLFKRDVTKRNICKSPDWENLYRLAFTHVYPLLRIKLSIKIWSRKMNTRIQGKIDYLWMGSNYNAVWNAVALLGVNLSDETWKQIADTFTKDGTYEIAIPRGKMNCQITTLDEIPVRDIMHTISFMAEDDYVSVYKISCRDFSDVYYVLDLNGIYKYKDEKYVEGSCFQLNIERIGTIDPWCLQEIHKYICGGKAKILV